MKPLSPTRAQRGERGELKKPDPVAVAPAAPQVTAVSAPAAPVITYGPNRDFAGIVEQWRIDTWASMPERHNYAPDAHIADCLPKLVEALRGNS